jgi:gamma-glutamylcysteine synthetase
MVQKNMNRILTGEVNVNTVSYGSEIEKVFSDSSGMPHAVDNEYFKALANISTERDGVEPEIEKTDSGTILGVKNAIGKESLDNSFLLGESSVWPPVLQQDGGLNYLHTVLKQQLKDVVEVLAPRDAHVLNMSNHPLTEITDENYYKHVAPKPVYGYMRNVRGWNHAAGINAKAQNSPSVGVSAEDAIDALNSSLALAPALIAMYGNSPFEQGQVASQKESRLGLWDTTFANNRFSGDLRTSRMPERPFSDFRDYFKWMFAEDTGMYFLVTDKDGTPLGSEKGQDATFISVDGHPTLLNYMRGEVWSATDLTGERSLTVVPDMGHFALHQFTHFADARIRYGLEDTMSVAAFNEAMLGSDREVDELFAEHGSFFYIEQREPGANFPDRDINMLGGEIADSVVISPAAICAGFIRNMHATKKLINRYGWDTLRGLRAEAVTHGLNGEYNDIKVKDLCYDTLEVAAQGLDQNEQWMLAYPEHVLRTGQSGADCALARYEELAGSPSQRIKQIAQERVLVLPQ